MNKLLLEVNMTIQLQGSTGLPCMGKRGSEKRGKSLPLKDEASLPVIMREDLR